MKKLAYVLIVVPLFAGGWILNDRATFDREAWLADYAQLRSATEESYANLRWSREVKQVDLVALNARALDQLQQVTSNSAARRAIADFIGGFNDGHFHLENGPPRPVAAVMRLFENDVAPEIDMAMESSEACAALGFKTQSHELAVNGAQPLTRTTFATGTVQTPNRRIFGVIRIPMFNQREYGGVCELAWQRFRTASNATCDEKCQDDFSTIVKHSLAQALADDARAILRAGAEAVVIDLTGNGGGTEWAEYAAAALSSRALQRPDVAFIRGEHWARTFADEITALDARLGTLKDAGERSVVLQARTTATAMRDSARTSCDVSAIWRNPNARPACWNIVVAPRSGLPRDGLRFARPFNDNLYILTDANTASASEQFTATLRDNGIATTIGQKTMGVGCGFTNGGNPTTLRNSGLVVWMPDCARLRKDGSNEFEGIQPDIVVNWGSDRESRTVALIAALDRLPKQ